MKTLLVMRHAKSDWSSDYGGDHERPLNSRGVAAAAHMGRLVREQDLIPQLVVSSTAVRARTTAELAIEAGEWGLEPTLEPGFYHSGSESVIARISQIGGAERVMVVGHQPTWGSLVYQLTGVPAEIKTATLAVIDLEIASWDQIEAGIGQITAVHHPPH